MINGHFAIDSSVNGEFASRDDRVEQANYGANETTGGDELRVITQTLAGDTNISFAFCNNVAISCGVPWISSSRTPGKVREKL